MTVAFLVLAKFQFRPKIMKAIDAILKWTVAIVTLATINGVASAQNAATQPAASKPALTASTKSTIDGWQALTASQKVALQPLSAVWASLSEAHKRKWLAISANFAQLTPQDKATLHSRMTEWASLSAKQRELARINFVQTKKLSTDDKQIKWQAYQALSAEEKQKLANINVATQPVGAATVVKPVPKDKLVRTPQVNGNALRPNANSKIPKRAVINNQVSVSTAPVPLRSSATAPVNPTENPTGKAADAP